jgi:seryl-tRNA synthetase
MLDIKLIREEPELVQAKLASRGAGDEAKIREVAALDERRRKGLTEVEQLKSLRNRVSKEIGALLAARKSEEAEAKKRETRELGDRIAQIDREVAEAEAARDHVLLRLPNLPHPSVVHGRSSSDNPVIRVWGEPPTFGFKPASHVELCEKLGLVDFARGAKLSGSGFLLFTPVVGRGWSGG